MSNRQPDYRIPAELVNHLAGAIAQPDADSLGQRLVADVFPLITDSPVLFVLAVNSILHNLNPFHRPHSSAASARIDG